MRVWVSCLYLIGLNLSNEQIAAELNLPVNEAQLTCGSAGQTMAILNNLVIRLALSNGERNLAKALRRLDAHPEEALLRICSASATL